MVLTNEEINKELINISSQNGIVKLSGGLMKK